MSALPCSIVVTGVAGSGKTTVAMGLAQHYGLVFLDADDFHSMAARAQMASGIPLDDRQREPWVDALGCELRRMANLQRPCVLAFSGLRAAHRQRLRMCGAPLRFVFLRGEADLIAARIAARDGHFMPLQLLPSQFDALEVPLAEPDVLTVDIDGSPDLVLERVIAALDANIGICGPVR